MGKENHLMRLKASVYINVYINVYVNVYVNVYILMYRHMKPEMKIETLKCAGVLSCCIRNVKFMSQI